MSALGKGSKECLAEVRMEVIPPENPSPTSQPQTKPAASVASDPPELQAATAIPAIVEVLQDVDRKYHKVIFRSVVDLLALRDSDCVKPWEVEKPITTINEPRRWWLLWLK